ncbi:hypothetical protein [Mesorhizobium sp. ES1-1]|uniref:ORC-CDC6 family AAA ATPase n=1 Tax=Mesorhizobium sp. ES1-1 TaxID=2876629 RepID=UPI001CCBFA33|nr:hypothetical protein [Mesorhizobium sp. ES1-1]MBZ9677811.1 hypothetical protein [Mesorhizobium sp. ES1-1]
MPIARYANPFAITKAVDLNDQQIESLWVRMMDDGEADELAELDHPTSPMPTFILGAKGSGKTHLMRHQAYELQKLRYKSRDLDAREGISDDGYIGLYVRCSGLQSSRFSGKRQLPELWDELFSYYFELWLAQHLLYVAMDLGLGALDGDENDLVDELVTLFDVKPNLPAPTLLGLSSALSEAQKTLDFEINNCLIKGSLDVQITATRGKLVFGIPKVLSGRYTFLRDVLFSYDIDEFENLTDPQQVHVNTLLREKEPPTTFRIGARSYGVKTQKTNSGGEENQADSEYREIHLDLEFREHKSQYSDFVKALIAKRLASGSGRDTDGSVTGFLDQYFGFFDTSWSNALWPTRLKQQPGGQRVHFTNLRKVLASMRLDEAKAGHAEEVLSSPEFPIIEKLNLLLLYQELAKRRSFDEALGDVGARFRRYQAGEESPQSSYKQALQHYSDDLAAQLLRENGEAQIYCGIGTFITMSAGIPRALLTVLRSTFEWAVFHDERPFDGGVISLRSQQRGVLEASNWYYNNMRKAGEDGLLVQTAVERLANLFRVNRFADKPIEVSLSSFSVAEQDLDQEARRILKLAEARAFIHRVPGGQRERNSENITAKFQLSPMLAPRWDLPLARRGVMPLSTSDFNAIFLPDRKTAYDDLVRKFRGRVMAPFRNQREEGSEQLGLFQ